MVKVKAHWEDRALAATRNTQFGAILRAALNRNTPDGRMQFSHGAAITSDGCIMCGFVDGEGYYHPGAFVGHVDDLVTNTRGLGAHLALKPEERRQLYSVVQSWISVDYRYGPGLFASS